MEKEVVVTGIGVVSSIGNDKDSFFNGLKNGVVGIEKFTSNDFPHYVCAKDEINLSGRIKNFIPENYFSKEEVSNTDYPTLIILKAIKEAVEDSKIDFSGRQGGIVMGTAVGLRPPYNRLNESFKAYAKGDFSLLPEPQYYPSFMMEFFTETVVKIACKKYGLKRVGLGVNSICVSGSLSICLGYDLIFNDMADVVICVGFDFFHPRQNRVFSHFKLLTSDKCRPFDKKRSGFQLAEGIGVVLLEKLEGARERNAYIYGKIEGYGITNDAYHLVIPPPQGNEYAEAIKLALKEAQVDLYNIDYVSPIGRGGKFSDIKEAHGIRKALGKESDKIPINSIVPNTGYALGASTILNFIATLLQMEKNILFPTLNHVSTDSKCRLNIVVNDLCNKEINTALVCGFAFTGINTAIVVKKYTS